MLSAFGNTVNSAMSQMANFYVCPYDFEGKFLAFSNLPNLKERKIHKRDEMCIKMG